jgi:nicotinamide-nucleotide amidase
MSIARRAARVARLLKETEKKIVFAESCTAGLVCASVTRTPGASELLCGGVVVYRNETKHAYLRIPRKLLDDPGPVSREVAQRMAQAVLKMTPEADFAVSVTGHLGPNSPPKLDGVVFVGLARRLPSDGRRSEIVVHKLQCRESDPRGVRQKWVVEEALRLVAAFLDARA